MVTIIKKEKILSSNAWIPDNKKAGHFINTNSWYSCNILHDSKQGHNNDIKTNNIRAKAIILNPDIETKKKLDTWFEIYRRVYNLTVKILKKSKESFTKFSLRDKVGIEYKNYPSLCKMVTDSNVYKHILYFAVFDVFIARKTAFTLLKLGHIKHFRMRYKKYSNPNKVLVLRADMFNKDGTGLKKKRIQIFESVRSYQNN